MAGFLCVVVGTLSDLARFTIILCGWSEGCCCCRWLPPSVNTVNRPSSSADLTRRNLRRSKGLLLLLQVLPFDGSEGRLRPPRGALEGNTLAAVLLVNELADTMEEVDPRRDGLGLLAWCSGALWSISIVMVNMYSNLQSIL
jgi:hypothetical protein